MCLTIFFILVTLNKMKSKRLIAVLLIFVFLSGVAVSGALVFRVQSVDVVFLDATRPEYLSLIERAEAIKTAREAATREAKGSNIIFGLNRTKIIKAVESAEKRIRVSNEVEAKIPNKVFITIRERYAMYFLEEYESGAIAILDARLRIVATQWDSGVRDLMLVDLSGTRDEISGAIQEPLFNIIKNTGGTPFTFQIGKDLTDYLEGTNNLGKAQRLCDMFEVLDGEGFPEEQIALLVRGILFDAVGSMILDFRNPNGLAATEIEIRNVNEQFKDKLWATFWVMQKKDNVSATIVADINKFDEDAERYDVPFIPAGVIYVLWSPK